MKVKNVLMLLAITLMCGQFAVAQNALNDKADNIVGIYESVQNGDRFRAKIEKLKDGTYRGQIIWMEKDKNKDGNKILDTKNPDKSLRNTPADRIVIFSGLKYDGKDHEWGGTKIYDPQRGVKAKMTASFAADGRLKITGSVLLISESVYWNKIN
jgi:uncharacterized protein (DUF2147 family)